MPRVLSKTGPGTVRTNSVCDEPGILTWPPKARTVVAREPGRQHLRRVCATDTVYSCRMTCPASSVITVGANTRGMGSSCANFGIVIGSSGT